MMEIRVFFFFFFLGFTGAAVSVWMNFVSIWSLEKIRVWGFGTARKWLLLWWVFNPHSPVHVAWCQDLFLKNILHSSTTLRRIACIGSYSSLRCMVLIWCLLCENHAWILGLGVLDILQVFVHSIRTLCMLWDTMSSFLWW
jgi:hypothetical protein